MDHSCYLCLVFIMFIAALLSPAWKGLTSLLLFVMLNCVLSLFHVVSWVRCYTCMCAYSEDVNQSAHQHGPISLSFPFEETLDPWLSIERTSKTDQTTWMQWMTRVFDSCTQLASLGRHRLSDAIVYCFFPSRSNLGSHNLFQSYFDVWLYV